MTPTENKYMDDSSEQSPQNKEPHSRSWIEKIAQNILTPHSHEDLLDIINDAAKKQVIDDESKEMISGVLNISTMHVRDIMVPRSQMVTLSINMTPDELISETVSSSHTRVPVFNDTRDDIVGILHAKDMLKLLHASTGQETPIINEILRPATFVPESKRLDSLLKEFKSSHNHLAIVVDEYGSISGLITIEDILEEIVGNIEDEFDEEEHRIQKVSDSEFHVEAITELDEFNDYFDSGFNNIEIDTIGGLILQSIEHLPEPGETITLGNFTFTVLNADKRKINTLCVTLNETAKY
jgi:magnesium and cobalt transporter